MRSNARRRRSSACAARSTRAACGSRRPANVERFTAEINDDLNLPRALALAWEVLRGELPSAARRSTLAAFDRVFGLGLEAWQPKQETIPEVVRALAAARAAATRRETMGRGRPATRGVAEQRDGKSRTNPTAYSLKRR